MISLQSVWCSNANRITKARNNENTKEMRCYSPFRAFLISCFRDFLLKFWPKLKPFLLKGDCSLSRSRPIFLQIDGHFHAQPRRGTVAFRGVARGHEGEPQG